MSKTLNKVRETVNVRMLFTCILEFFVATAMDSPDRTTRTKMIATARNFTCLWRAAAVSGKQLNQTLPCLVEAAAAEEPAISAGNKCWRCATDANALFMLEVKLLVNPFVFIMSTLEFNNG